MPLPSPSPTGSPAPGCRNYPDAVGGLIRAASSSGHEQDADGPDPTQLTSSWQCFSPNWTWSERYRLLQDALAAGTEMRTNRSTPPAAPARPMARGWD